MDQKFFRLMVVVGLAAVVWAACGKKEEPLPATPAVPAKKVEQPKETSKAPVVVTPVRPAKTDATVMPAAPAKDDATEPTLTPVELEKNYLANPDFTERVQVIFQLSDLGTADSLVVLGRIFHKEQDPDLRIQILNSLFDIEGQDDKKAVLLAAGAATNQPKEVREAAIDALGDIEAKRALPILQAMLDDADEDIREHAKDTIEQIQTQDAMQK